MVATTATKGFGTALKATGIGLIISALAYLVANFDDVKKTVLGIFPGLGHLGEMFDKVKEIAFGVGNVILQYIVTPFKAVMKLVTGDFKGALQAVKDGSDVVGNFKKGAADETARIADNHRKEELKKETEQTDKLIEIMDARGQDTYKIESENYKKKLSLLEEGSKEYEDLLQEQAVFEAKNLKDRDEAAKKAAEKAAELAKKQAEKMLELKKQYGELSSKIDKDLEEAQALNSPGGQAVDKYKKDLVEISATQTEEKAKLDTFLKSKVISITEYNTQIQNIYQQSQQKTKLAEQTRDKGILEEAKKTAEEQLKILKSSQALQETAL